MAVGIAGVSLLSWLRAYSVINGWFIVSQRIRHPFPPLTLKLYQSGGTLSGVPLSGEIQSCVFWAVFKVNYTAATPAYSHRRKVPGNTWAFVSLLRLQPARNASENRNHEKVSHFHCYTIITIIMVIRVDLSLNISSTSGTISNIKPDQRYSFPAFILMAPSFIPFHLNPTPCVVSVAGVRL